MASRQPLLGHLASHAALASQGERLCTVGLAHVLGDPLVQERFARWIVDEGDVPPLGALTWRAEAFHASAGFVDVEGRRDRTPVVMIEGKLSAPFGDGQLAAYARVLAAVGDHDRALLALVPHRSAPAAREILAAAVPDPPAKMAVSVVTWESLFAALDGEGRTADVDQLQALYEALRGKYLQPLSGAELAEWRQIRVTLEAIADQVTLQLRPGQRPNPSGREDGEDDEVGFWYRYISRDTPEKGVSLAVVVRPTAGSRSAPMWVRYSTRTPSYPSIVANLEASDCYGPQLARWAGALWVPLEVPAETEAAEMISTVAEQVAAIDAAAQGI
ncbi:hypothetical protein [Rhabdothermincola salaria]|uniref:hypothetical protein n=1 Tax=Rhabdothermincola salaria TaxID=2903142 RepID=UPI001E3F5426|nr:hypothetical protein [Rhabdothermincola salaria]MCD9624225.1 hypothetical protein [Rhabdothermincola salaria]